MKFFLDLKFITFVLSSISLTIPVSSFSSLSYFDNFTMKEMFQRLIRDNPTIVLLDDSESDLEFEIRESLEMVDNAGSLVFTFNPWWKYLKQRIKPRIGAARTAPFRWTFISVIEEKRTKNRADKYLQELLTIGHAREDRFMLLGLDKYLYTFLRSSQIEKFQNIVGIPIDKQFIYQRHAETPKSKVAQFTVVSDLQSVYWFTEKTASLHGQHFRISGTQFPPYLDWVFNKTGHKVLWGQNYRIFHEASLYHNYTYEFNPVEDWKLTGKKFPNGTWDGVYGDLLYGKADIASVSTQTRDRNGLADFVGPFGRAHLVFVTAPPEKHLGKYAMFKSYTIGVWAFILGFFAVFVALFYHAFKISVKRGRVKANRLLLKSVMLVWSLSFEQTEEKRPRGIRLLMIMWVAFIVVIGTGYRSNLAASISLPEPEQKPKTFRQLSEQTNYRINFDLSGISAWNHFEESNNSIIRNIYRRSTTMENTTDCVVSSFLNQNTVCIGWDFTLKTATAKNLTIAQFNNPVVASTDAAWAAWYTFALPKNSIFTEAFQFIGQTLFERGLTAYWRGRLLHAYRNYGMEWTNSVMNSELYRKLVKLRRSSKTETKPLKVENFEFIFVILMIGLTISLFRFCYEVWSIRGTVVFCRKRGYLGQPDSGRRCRRITVESRVYPIDFVP